MEIAHPRQICASSIYSLAGSIRKHRELSGHRHGIGGQDLADRFKECRSQGLPGIPRAELLNYVAEAAEVLDLMNSQYQLQHLDIKPQNLFLVHQHIKVADFGLVKDTTDGKSLMTITGGVTPVYAAPETFDGQFSRESDQYSLAIV